MRPSLLLVPFLLVSLPAAADFRPPVPEPANASPAYPEKAMDEEVEGEAAYLARVAADGSVAAVVVESVPAADHGFEEAVASAVKGWRFTPARRDGLAVESTVRGKLRFTLDSTMSRARAFPVAPSRLFEAARLALEAIEREDPSEGILFGRSATPEGPVRYFVFVPPNRIPSRIYVGSESAVGFSDGPAPRRYNDPRVARAFLDALEARVGTPGRFLPLWGEARVSALRKTGSEADCPATVAPGSPAEFLAAASGKRKPDGDAIPVPIRESRLDTGGEGGRVNVVVNDDGVVVLARPVSARASEVEIATAVASLLRFRPASRDGCPVPAARTIELPSR